MKIEFENLDTLFDCIANDEAMRRSMGKACALLEREAKENCHFKHPTGDLKRSIASKVDVNTNEVIGTVYTPLEYAPYVEYGTGLFAEEGGRKDVPWHYQDEKGQWHTTSGQHPQPFMRPALDNNREKVIKIIQEGLLG